MLIVAHDTEGVDSRATLKHGDGRSVSIHRLIQKFPRANGTTDILPGKPERQSSGVVIYDMVPDERGANHAGYATWKSNGRTFTPTGVNVNVISLGFELECLGSKDKNDHYTEDQLLAAGFVINQWRAKYGPLPLVRHADIDSKRRSDTYNLSVADLEKWANAATLVYDVDPFAAWGDVGKPTGAAAGFAIPKAWLVNKVLGRCVVPEAYSASGKYSRAEFEHGLITYFVARKAAIVELF
jgi:hypothetical protein